MKPLRISPGLKLGCATAATQIEGGDYHSNWYHWGELGKIDRGESPIVAADHYNRVGEDIGLMKSLNQEIYRFSIEWSRIEPEEGKWSEEGIDHYKDEINQLLACGIEPLVTLHHFSQPQWFDQKGGWVNTANVDYFLRFVSKVVEEYVDIVNEYCTINEPNVYVNDTYMDGKYPPGHKDDVKSYFKASKNLILAHNKAYQIIHKIRKSHGHRDTKVGMALHMAYFDLEKQSPIAGFSKNMMDQSFHGIFLKGMVEGKSAFPIGLGSNISEGIVSDFLGVNYYSRHLIRTTSNPTSFFGEVVVDESLTDDKLNDLGWEIYPEGLYKVLKKLYETYELPIYITENGIPDTSDSKRAKFIYDHLVQIQRLIDSGVDVQKYYHWSLLDNMEWNDGYQPRFGLIEVDYETLERRVRESGHFYGQICKTKEIDQELINKYLK